MWRARCRQANSNNSDVTQAINSVAGERKRESENEIIHGNQIYTSAISTVSHTYNLTSIWDVKKKKLYKNALVWMAAQTRTKIICRR